MQARPYHTLDVDSLSRRVAMPTEARLSQLEQTTRLKS